MYDDFDDDNSAIGNDEDRLEEKRDTFFMCPITGLKVNAREMRPVYIVWNICTVYLMVSLILYTWIIIDIYIFNLEIESY